MTWVYAGLGLALFGVVVGLVWLIVRGVRAGIQAEPLIEQAKRETEDAKRDVAAHQRAEPSPGVLLDVLRDMDGEPRG